MLITFRSVIRELSRTACPAASMVTRNPCRGDPQSALMACPAHLADRSHKRYIRIIRIIRFIRIIVSQPPGLHNPRGIVRRISQICYNMIKIWGNALGDWDFLYTFMRKTS
jgi:hypothetical protein